MAAQSESLLDSLEGSGRAARPRAPVVLAVALDQSYDYLVPEGLELEPGAFVLVPFGPQSRIGVVWDTPVGEPGSAVDPKKLKTISGRLDVPPLPLTSLRFAEWIARYTVSPLGMVVRMMMSARAAFDPGRRGARAAARDAGAPARAQRRSRRRHPHQVDARRRGSVLDRRRRWARCLGQPRRGGHPRGAPAHSRSQAPRNRV
jgi:primosomal protein N' (replication factor Y)